MVSSGPFGRRESKKKESTHIDKFSRNGRISSNDCSYHHHLNIGIANACFKKEIKHSSLMSIINSTILLVIVILAILFFVFGLLQFLIRCIIKRPIVSSISESIGFPDASDHSHALQSQLQHLFRQHDSGVDHSLVEALPVFYYKEIVGLKAPFDCAVCLSEFSDADALKLLVNCSHAFHIHCIETWLMSNSTCPLCRRPISSETHQRTSFSNLEDSVSRNGAEILQENSFCVRLGKFRKPNDGSVDEGGRSGSLDARRCYSMGAFHYIVGEAELQVTLSGGNRDLNKDGGKISVRSRDESLSVSKIWLWSKKREFRSSFHDHCSVILPHPSRSNLA